MRSNVHRLRRVDPLKAEQAKCDKAELARLVESFVGSDGTRRHVVEALAEVGRGVDGRIEAVPFEEFLMLYTRQNLAVLQYLRRESRYKIIAPVVWAVVLSHVRDETYEVYAEQSGLIAEVGASPRAVRQVLKELVEFQALRALRVPEPGKQGRGTVRYFLNAKVGSREKGTDARRASRAAAPNLGVVVNLDGSGGPGSGVRRRAPAFVVPAL